MDLPGLGKIEPELGSEFIELTAAADGLWEVGRDGVQKILTPADRKVEFVVFADKTLAYVKSALGHPAVYPVPEVRFEAPAEAVLMDLDGTSVRSEAFWIWVIEQVVCRLLGDPRFELEAVDEPHVSGHSVSEHLQYCIDKYCPDKAVEEAREAFAQLKADGFCDHLGFSCHHSPEMALNAIRGFDDFEVIMVPFGPLHAGAARCGKTLAPRQRDRLRQLSRRGNRWPGPAAGESRREGNLPVRLAGGGRWQHQ